LFNRNFVHIYFDPAKRPLFEIVQECSLDFFIAAPAGTTMSILCKCAELPEWFKIEHKGLCLTSSVINVQEASMDDFGDSESVFTYNYDDLEAFNNKVEGRV